MFAVFLRTLRRPRGLARGPWGRLKEIESFSSVGGVFRWLVSSSGNLIESWLFLVFDGVDSQRATFLIVGFYFFA